MTPELTKELIVGSLSVVLTALFTGVPAVVLVWWTWQRDQERLVVQKLITNWPTSSGGWILETDQFGPVFGILIRNRSLFPVHVSSVGFDIDGEIIELERPLFAAKMKRNPDPRSNRPNIADDGVDPREILSLKSMDVMVNPEDRPKLSLALSNAAKKHNLKPEDFLVGARVNALVVLETGKIFSSMPFFRRMRRKVWRKLRFKKAGIP